MDNNTRGPAWITPPPLLYLLGVLVGIALNRLHPVPFIPGVPKRWRRALGVGLLAGGLGLAGAAVRTFREHGVNPDPRTPVPTLVTQGPYARTRNPIYLGFTFASAGLACLANAGWCWPSLLGVLVVMQRGVIPREERYLAQRFGQAYADYCARVPRWL